MSLGEGYARNLGFKVGSIRGIEIWIHWVLLIILGILLLSFHLRDYAHPFSTWVVLSTTLLISLLIHELGHCVAAHRQGGGADRIVLWPLGGLAFCDAPQQPASQFWVAAGGPIATALLGAGAAGACGALGWSLLPVFEPDSFPFWRLFAQHLVLWNLFLIAVNLWPCYPLDGGRMLQAAAWGKLESHGQATLLALRVGQVAAVLALVIALCIFVAAFRDRSFALRHPLLGQLQWGLLLVAAVHFFEGKALQHRLAHGEEEDGIFGYDFSRGYTSLERTATRPARRKKSFLGLVRDRFRGRAVALKREREKEMRERLDGLLQKIHHHGIQSLSRSERRFLARASRLFKR